MKYYVYAGYYENFISGHKLPKPYTLRDEFKTFDEALDYVLENWEDDAIFFTEDVIGDAIDNGLINDEDWEDYLMKESKAMSYDESKKSMKEFNEDINNTAYFDRVAGELHSWYVCYVEDYERKYEYGFKNEKECINWIKKNGFDLDPSMIESKKSARKSIKESRGQTVAELLQNASIKTIVHIYNASTSDEFLGTNDQLKGEFSRFLYYTVSVWNIGNDKIVNIYCY